MKLGNLICMFTHCRWLQGEWCQLRLRKLLVGSSFPLTHTHTHKKRKFPNTEKLLECTWDSCRGCLCVHTNPFSSWNNMCISSSNLLSKIYLSFLSNFLLLNSLRSKIFSISYKCPSYYNFKKLRVFMCVFHLEISSFLQ